MGLTAAEQAERESLQNEVGHLMPQGLTPDEQAERESLRKEVGHLVPQSGPSIGRTILDQGANSAALGYLPQMQAAASKPIYAGLNALTGQNVQPDSYVNERDKNIGQLQSEEEANPKTALASKVGGGIIGAIATPLPEMKLAKGAGLMARGAAKLGEGAVTGAGYGAIQNPGDVQGKVAPIQGDERVDNAKTGAKIGLATTGVTGAVAKGLRGGAELSGLAQKTGQEQAVKSTGAMLRDFRQLNGKDQTNKLGQWLLDRGIVGAGDTVRTVADKSDSAVDDAGKRLDDIYDAAVSSASQKSPEEMSSFGFNPSRDKKQIIDAVKEKLGDVPKAKSAVEEVSNYLDDLTEKYGDKGLSPKDANNIKSLMDKEINYSRNPLNPRPNSEMAYSAARNELKKIIDQHIELVGRINEDPEITQRLKAANQDYGFAKQASNMSHDRIAREEANRIFSLTDTIAGTAGGVAGAAMSGGGDMKSGAEGIAGGALAAGLLNHAARKYGPSTLASGLNMAKTPLQATRPLGMLGRGVGSQSVNRGFMNAGLLNNGGQ